jgi:hypothetical protein
MDNATLIARVRLVMQALQERRAARLLRLRGEVIDAVREFDERPADLPP